MFAIPVMPSNLNKDICVKTYFCGYLPEKGASFSETTLNPIDEKASRLQFGSLPSIIAHAFVPIEDSKKPITLNNLSVMPEFDIYMTNELDLDLDLDKEKDLIGDDLHSLISSGESDSDTVMSVKSWSSRSSSYDVKKFHDNDYLSF